MSSERRRFWHPFADMQTLGQGSTLKLTRGDGCYVYDSADRRYFDMSASLWYCLVGHGRSELARAAADQLSRLETYSCFGDLSNEPAEQLVERLTEIAPVTDPVAFFTSGGSDSIDTAMKMARRYWQAIDQPERTVFLTRTKAYHGMHIGGTSLVGIDPMRAGYGPLLDDVVRVPWDSIDAMARTIDELGQARVAGVFCEPILGVGGVRHPPANYLNELEILCRDSGALLIADEVVTGFGRVGAWFASQRFGIQPDLIVCAKGITSGYLPLGAVIAGRRVAEPFYDGTVGMWRHGYTYSGHATSCAVALANLAIIEREQLIEAARELEVSIATALSPLEGHALVNGVSSGLGAFAAIELSPAALSEEPTLPQRLSLAMREQGLLTRALVGGELQVSPPLTTGPVELRRMQEGLLLALDQCAATLSRAVSS
jgi:adenosylmethionine-8-amino-7-oxononanoate aminotransferase